ncbi:glycoside hydrolase family 2 TIM barrel-domain containing protein [Butyrivibrio sp. MC2013]|uniref:glycoside hydrolase family 2 TIM barrel-domain containing protein n=1 Tax=Butyrivibrio sp. MC2013 TaxID=1280686 RepID=UPI000412A8E4|nr:glycoside hydrolase family 2 TIM barrel-domain containing protein [Butyrivibrio sp. MC2013]
MDNFDYAKLSDCSFYEENRQKAHSDHVCFANRQEMALGVSSYRYSLDGVWKFSYARSIGEAVEGFWRLDHDCHGWDSIRVPSHIQMEGYGNPQYVNIQYPWDGHENVEPGAIPQLFNPVASYVKYFNLPENMKDKRVFISFQGAESCVIVWLNGSYVGYSENSFDPAEFELTPYLLEGENKLSVRVIRFCSGSWTEDQDFFRFSGLYRSVYLYACPKVHLRDITVRTAYDSARGSARVSILSSLQAAIPCRIKYSLKYHGELAASQVMDIEEIIGDEQEVSSVLELSDPALWSAEKPELYDLFIDIEDMDAAILECSRINVGIRSFEIKDGIMQLNCKRIVFKGANRHDFSALRGRAISADEVEQDIINMKRNNINAIRTSHYPDISYLYDLCDRYGLYLIAENNMESHGAMDMAAKNGIGDPFKVPGDRQDWKALMLDRVDSCYHRDKNHPSILIWSIGNESSGGLIPYEMSRRFKELDPARPVHYEGISSDRRYNDTSDIESRMYTHADEIEKYLTRHRDKPYICCEYTHAMGNSCGAMDKYTQLAYRDELYQGGFIWDYIDQAITVKDRYGREYEGYGGDFGDRPCDYDFSGNGIAFSADRKSSPKMQAVKYNYRNIEIEINCDKNDKAALTALVRNRNLFTSTGEYDCIVILEKEGREIEKVNMDTDIAPFEEKKFSLPLRLPEDISVYNMGEYTVTVSFRLKEDTSWAKRGHEVSFGQAAFSLYPAADRRDAIGRALDMSGRYSPDLQHSYAGNELIYSCGADDDNLTLAPMEIVKGAFNLGVRGRDFEVLFNHQYGGLSSYRYAGVELFDKMPGVNFWRPAVQNDTGNRMPQRYGQWKLAGSYAAYDQPKGYFPKIREDDHKVEVTYAYVLPSSPEGRVEVTYTVYADGTIRVRESMKANKALPDMPEYGMILRMPADYDNISWYGLGPDECYADRMQGARLGIYSQKVRDAFAPYLVPQESGNKMGVRWARVTDKRGRGLMLAGDAMNVSALPWSPEEIDAAGHPYELPPIHHTWIRCAAAQMGVGGDDSWGSRVHDEFLLPKGRDMTFEFAFRGI